MAFNLTNCDFIAFFMMVENLEIHFFGDALERPLIWLIFSFSTIITIKLLKINRLTRMALNFLSPAMFVCVLSWVDLCLSV